MKNQYIGKQTAQAITNFPFSYPLVAQELIYAIAEIKKAAAIANYKIGDLDEERQKVIVAACDEILPGKLDDQFPVGAFQGGAGTSINMNVNEVIANRATEMLASKGKTISVHPNDHVNKAQSTNDVNPAALKIASVRLARRLLEVIAGLTVALSQKASDFGHINKLGRTHLQDAIPVTMGDEFSSWAASLERDRKRIEGVLSFFIELNLGGTAVGNAVNASPEYIKAVYGELRSITGLDVKPAGNLMSLTSSQTDFCMLSQALVLLGVDASKMANDIRLLASGPIGGLGEISLTELQPGSSIMPGKVNPVLPEAVNQLYFLLSGNNLTIEHAAQASQLELGVMFPILSDRLLQSLKLSAEVLEKFTNTCVKDIRVNEDMCRTHLERSTAYATLLTPKLGYDVVSAIVKESVSKGKSIRELVVGKNLLTDKEFDNIVHMNGKKL